MNVLNHKEILILEYFYNNQNKYLTSKKVAKNLGVTEKTARKYINQLIQAIDDDLACITSTPGHGFKIVIRDEEKFRIYFQSNKKEQLEKSNIRHIEDSKDRQYFILRKIFFDNKEIFFDNVMLDLAVSQSTLLNDIQSINKKLKHYDLSLRTSKINGLSVEGNERDKRHFIMNYFFVERLQNNLKSLGEISKLLTAISPEEILLIVLDECRNAGLKLNDTVMLNIVTHISLALKRVEEGYQIKFNQYFNKGNYTQEIFTAEKIVNRLRKSSDIHLPDEEIYNIALHLKNKSSKSSFTIVDEETKCLREAITKVLEEIEWDSGVLLSKDPILLNGLIDHFSPFIDRMRNNNKLSNPLLKEILSNYKYEFELTKKYFSKMEQLKNFGVTDDEWAYISLHIIAALERKIKSEKKNTLVICATGLGSSQMLKVRLENELGSKLNIVKVISYYEITDEVLQDIDLIVSSIDLSNVVFNIPVVNVSVLLNEEDIKLINQFLGTRVASIQKPKTDYKIKENQVTQLINKYFHPDLFLLSNTIVTKNEALNLLADKSIQLDTSIIKHFLMNQLKLRENFSSVVFSKHIAVPHPIEGVGNIPRVGILITPRGIAWDEASKDIKLTILMIPDRFGNNQIDEVSKALLPIIEKDEYLDEIVKVNNYEEFINKLTKLLTR